MRCKKICNQFQVSFQWISMSTDQLSKGRHKKQNCNQLFRNSLNRSQMAKNNCRMLDKMCHMIYILQQFRLQQLQLRLELQFHKYHKKFYKLIRKREWLWQEVDLIVQYIFLFLIGKSLLRIQMGGQDQMMLLLHMISNYIGCWEYNQSINRVYLDQQM